MPKMLESATAEEGFMRKDESRTLELAVSVSQTEKVCGRVGAFVARRRPANELVAVVLVA